MAFITFDTIAAPFYFVLEPGHTTITIHRDRWSIIGGRGNNDYTRFLNQRQRLIDERKRNLDRYLQAAADSTLSLRGERKAFVTDSLLSDSLQRLLRQHMARRDAVGRIICERFGTTPADSIR